MGNEANCNQINPSSKAYTLMGGNFYGEMWNRFALLGSLMVLQSMSSFILSHFQTFIENHIFVTLYLTMLVGAGGNAGNQSAVLVIRGIAVGKIGRNDYSVLRRESIMAVFLATLMFAAGFARVFFFQG